MIFLLIGRSLLYVLPAVYLLVGFALGIFCTLTRAIQKLKVTDAIGAMLLLFFAWPLVAALALREAGKRSP